MKKFAALTSALALIPTNALADGGYSDSGDVDGVVIFFVLFLVVIGVVVAIASAEG